MGQVFYDFSRGIDNRPVISEWERKSVSCEQTFESDISENAAVTIHLYHTVLELVRRIEKNDFEGRTLTLKVKFLDFQQITRSITVDHILRTKDEILPLAKQLMQQVINGLSWNWNLSRGQTYNKSRDGDSSNIQTDKPVVDAHRKEWRRACIGTYRNASREGNGIHR